MNQLKELSLEYCELRRKITEVEQRLVELRAEQPRKPWSPKSPVTVMAQKWSRLSQQRNRVAAQILSMV